MSSERGRMIVLGVMIEYSGIRPCYAVDTSNGGSPVLGP